jgi:hypothetical protein
MKLIGFIILLSFSKIATAQDSFKLDLSNPVLFAGSDLPHFYQRLWINSNFEIMLKFTASSSRRKYSDQKLIEYFGKMQFGYEFKLKSRKYEKDGSQILSCLAKINATDVVVRFRCLVESDTSKIIIDELGVGMFP